jgi:RNA polymerase sigma factor (sigma-70 family)
MAEPSLNTIRLHLLWGRMRQGNGDARNELLQSIAERFERLARKMLRQFPGVARHEQTGDVVQNATLRLLKALEEIQPASIRDLMGLAALQIRRELLDLSRSHRGRKGGRIQTLRHADLVKVDASSQGDFQPMAVVDEDVEAWESLHRAVEQLSTEEREVFSLVFYHGWPQADVAELFQVTDRTVRRWWQSACLKLHQLVGGKLPSA